MYICIYIYTYILISMYIYVYLCILAGRGEERAHQVVDRVECHLTMDLLHCIVLYPKFVDHLK